MPEQRVESALDPVDERNLRAVVDTNVLVSGLMGVGSPPRQVIDAWLDQSFTLVTTLYLVQELAHVLSYPRIAARIRLDEEEVDAIVAALLSEAEVTPGELEPRSVTRDPKDDAVVACAVEGGADFVVSGDEDLLVLERYEGVRFVTPRQFVGILRRGGD